MSKIIYQGNEDDWDKPSLCKKFKHNTTNPYLRNGDGFLSFDTNDYPENKDSTQHYRGHFFRDNLHKEGIYTRLKPDENYIYEGEIYANKFEGYARTIRENVYFEGLYQRNHRYGPGVLTYPNGTQDVGLWMGPSLIRLSMTVLPEWIPKLATTYLGKIKLLGYRKLIPVQKEKYVADIIGLDMKQPELLYNQNISNPDSSFFDKPAFDYDFFGNETCCIDVAISPEDIIEENDNNVDVYLKVQETIESLMKNVEHLTKCSKKELELIETKCRILKSFAKHNPPNSATKQVPITDLLAWNNGEIAINMLQHAFLHRNGESIVNFSVPKLLAGERKSFSNPGKLECACIAFLTYCSTGEEEKAENLLKTFNINPDICDACGNNGVIYAVCRDRISTIRKLTQLGANLEFINDDCLLPLTIVLTRYICKLKGIQDWEKSFLITPMSSEESDEVNAWCPRGSFINLLTDDCLINHDLGIFFPDDYQFFHYEGNGQKMNILESIEKIGLAKIDEDDIQDFQTPFQNLFNVEASSIDKTSVSSPKGNKAPIPESYVFHTVLTKSKKVEKKSVECPELVVIYNTIKTLLFYGADPNIGDIPLPVLILALYTENVEILNDVLTAGANPNMTYNSMGPLHFLCNMPINESLEEMALILLSHGADPNLLTSTTHWPEEQKRILADYPQIYEVGKTPLHILCMRLDGSGDPELAKILLNHGAKDINYLGHTALTLAILSGNLSLVQSLLECRLEPNVVLDNNMGTPLSIYTLKRYENSLPNIEICQKIIEVLIEYFANPLNPFYNFANVAEFIKSQKAEEKVGEKVKDKKKKKKKPKKKKKSKKKSKISGREIIIAFLIQKCRETVFRHYQFKMHLLFLKNVVCNEPVDKTFIKFLSVEEAVGMHQILINIGAINLENNLHVFLTSKLFQNYQEFGFKIKAKKEGKKKGKKKKKPKPKKKSKSKSSSKSKNTPKIKTPKEKPDILSCFYKPDKKISRKQRHKNCELDHIESKYEICFHCILKTNKVLIPCPKCGLVYFCSEACNKANNRMKGRHPCKTLFYKTLNETCDEKIDSNINLPYIFKALEKLNSFHDFLTLVNEFKTIPDFVNPFAPVISLRKSKYGKTSSALKIAPELGKEDKGENTKIRYDYSKHNDSSDESNLKHTRSKIKSEFKLNEVSSITSKLSQIIDAPVLKIDKALEEKLKNCVVRKLISGSIVPKKHVSRAKKVSRIEKTYYDDTKETTEIPEADLEADLILRRQSRLRNSFSKLKVNSRKNLVNNVREFKSFNDMPKYLVFMKKIFELFPDFDMAALFMPFVCLTDGQLFYRFLDRTPIFCPTYTNV